MTQKQEVSDILNTGKKIKTNTIHETSAVTNASNQSSRSGTFNFHDCSHVNIIFNNSSADKFP